MRKTWLTLTSTLVLLSMVSCTESHFREDKIFAGGLYVKKEVLNTGKQIYTEYCMPCHGVDGDGKGVAAKAMKVPPRDFTSGVFKFGEVPAGELPHDKHLFKIRNDLNEFIYESNITIPRASFSTLSNIWAKSNPHQEEIITTEGVNHPKRPTCSTGELLYKKYFPTINKNISFRVIDIDKDLENFHKWHNKEFIWA